MKLIPILLLASATCFAQKKILDHSVYGLWKRIESQQISSDGQWVACTIVPQTEGDGVVQLWNAKTKSTQTFARAAESRFSDDSQYLFFKIKPTLDTLKALRRKKVKDEDLPKDSLVIFSLKTSEKTVIPAVRSYSVPEKWNGWVLFTPEIEKPPVAKKDTAIVGKDSLSMKLPAAADSLRKSEIKPDKPAKGKNEKKPKKEGKENGYKLVLRELATAKQDTFYFVQNYIIAEKGPRLLFVSSGKDSTFLAGIYTHQVAERNTVPLSRAKGKYKQLALDKLGTQAAFLADTDTSKARIRPWRLMRWTAKQDSAKAIAGAEAGFLPKNWNISENAPPVFSESGQKLFFGMAPPPILNDTTLLPEEVVNVEVWAYTDPVLYTVQKVRVDAERNRSYQVVCDLSDLKCTPLGSLEIPEIRYNERRETTVAVGINEDPYALQQSWEGTASKDVWLVQLNSGKSEKIATKLRGNPRLSPEGRFVTWFNEVDTAWYACQVSDKKIRQLTDNSQVAFFDEENDTPDLPGAFGMAGWLTGEDALLIYDKFDIWKIDPKGKDKPKRLTQGRETETVFRYLRLDPDRYTIEADEKIWLHYFSEKTKNEGYAQFDMKNGRITYLMGGPFAYSRSPKKAQNSDATIFTFENFQTFPDVHYYNPSEVLTSRDLPKSLIQRVTDANPQQKAYNWGTIELVSWTSLDGTPLQGCLVKPENYDSTQKYPLIVQFYERSSDQLNTHRPPDAGRSQINYSFYASRGYLIFNPDIPYRIGYPGESAYNAIMPGVTMLIDKGMVDPARIGIQGHSWGGYQTAYLVTKTKLFACAEAGAAVANMVSAYGGIRWESGSSRMFQYEHQQSRIGGTLWQYPFRYYENSPIFSVDKITTPLLLIHNDKDGAVPWYQGIELFTAMRRLNKPCWLLNYNEEPHWPVKLQNRVDFQMRMQQFFDYYLQGKPKPRWMQRGVPALEKGILQGLEGE